MGTWNMKHGVTLRATDLQSVVRSLKYCDYNEVACETPGMHEAS